MSVPSTNYDETKDYILIEDKDIVDNLDSTEPKLPLSANQGKVLNEKILKINKHITSMRYITKVFHLPNSNGFMDLYFKPQIMELLGLPGSIDKFNEKVTFHIINGDWSTQNMCINGMAYDPAKERMVIHYDNGIANGACRLNFLIVYSEEGEIQQ